ncbi:MarR family winged helix-turn-helix transcriptional regulator [Roseibium sp.]|uniref:MarR family winged helix-turn-helix transcriptional regulator n=1 Tax=Roseibium sp. TaxID=1936156 RepID=UPI003A983857
MVSDIVRTLGYTTLGTRLKRTGEKLQADTQELTKTLTDIDLPVAHNPALAALDANGPMSIGDLSLALGLSQPGVTRMIGKMKAAGLVEITSNEKDKRISLVTLSEHGQRLTDQLKAVLWPAVEQAVADACSSLSGSLLDQLGQLEHNLANRPLTRRIRVRVKTR